MYRPTSGPSANTRVNASHSAVPARSLYSAARLLQPSTNVTIAGSWRTAAAPRSRRRSSSARRKRISRVWRSRSAARMTAPDVRQRRQRRQLAGPEVDGVQVQVVGRLGAGQRQRQAGQRRGGAAAADAVHDQVAVVRGTSPPGTASAPRGRRPGRGARSPGCRGRPAPAPRRRRRRRGRRGRCRPAAGRATAAGAPGARCAANASVDRRHQQGQVGLARVGPPSTGAAAAAAGSTGGGGSRAGASGPYTNGATSTCDSDASSRDPVDSADWIATTSPGPSRT